MNNVKSRLKGNLKQYSMLIALVVIIIFFNILTSGRLLRPMNVSNIVFQNAYVVILAVGMLLHLPAATLTWLWAPWWPLSAPAPGR